MPGGKGTLLHETVAEGPGDQAVREAGTAHQAVAPPIPPAAATAMAEEAVDSDSTWNWVCLGI